MSDVDFRPLRDQLLRCCAGASADAALCALACALGEAAGGTDDPHLALDRMVTLARAVVAKDRASRAALEGRAAVLN